MGHRVVGGVTIGEGGVISSAYGVAVGLESSAVTGLELGEGTDREPGGDNLAEKVTNFLIWSAMICIFR